MAESGWQYFSVEELTCHCGCGRSEMDHDFMAKLVAVRRLNGRPMNLSSAFRCPEYDASIGGAGVHPTGHAVDILISGENALDIILLAHDRGMSGFGIKQHGDHASRFVHLDDLVGGKGPRPWIWSYK